MERSTMSAGNWRWRSQPDKEGFRTAQLKVERGKGRVFTKSVRAKSAREVEKELANFVTSIDGGNVATAPARLGHRPLKRIPKVYGWRFNLLWGDQGRWGWHDLI
jgi:hypothetical protein